MRAEVVAPFQLEHLDARPAALQPAQLSLQAHRLRLAEREVSLASVRHVHESRQRGRVLLREPCERRRRK